MRVRTCRLLLSAAAWQRPTPLHSRHFHRQPITMSSTTTTSSSSPPSLPTSSSPSLSSSLLNKPKILVIAGPTGIGKSSLAIQLASSLNGEIISADSVQLYRPLSIGSNKLPPSLRSPPHHLIDCADLNDDWTVADWHRAATRLIDDITSRGKLPVVVGGTMLYFRWLLYGQPLKVGTTEESRARAEEWIRDERGWDEKVAELDLTSDAVAYLNEVRGRNCNQRLARALEILFLSSAPPPPITVPTPTSLPSTLQYDARCILLTTDRTWLTRQLDYRCEAMLHQGLLSETFPLFITHQLQSSSQAHAIGYRQATDFLSIPHPTPTDFLHLLTSLQTATRRYVRRQLTFFRAEHAYRFIHLPSPVLPVKGDVPHPSTVQMREEVWEGVVERVKRWVRMRGEEWWREMVEDEGVRREQVEVREGSKEEPNAPARRLYQTKLFIYNDREKVEQVLESVRRMKQEWKEREGGNGEEGSEEKQPHDQQVKLVMSGT